MAINAPLASPVMERCLNPGGLGPGPAEVIKLCLPLRFQLHVKLLLTSRSTQLCPAHQHRVKSHKPQLQTVGPEPISSNRPVSCLRHTLLPSSHSEPSSFHSFHPKFAAVGSGAGLGSFLCSPGWGTKIQVPQASSDSAPSHAERQTCCPLSPCASLPGNKAKRKQTPQTSHPARAPGQEVTGGTPGPLCHPNWCSPSQILPAASTSGPEKPNVGCKRAPASQYPRKALFLLCSSIPSRSHTQHSLRSLQLGGTPGTVPVERAVPPCPC